MYTAILQLSPPAFLHLQSSDGSKQAKLDVYAARRMLEEAERQPTPEAHNKAILDWLAGKLQCERDSLAENMAIELNDCIVKLVEKLNSERQKKTEQTASSLTFIPESPTPSATGP